jgi:excisionase family DNA binding protein
MTRHERQQNAPSWMKSSATDVEPEVIAGHTVSAELMTPNEVCDFLKITKDWLYDQIQAERIPHIRLGRHLRFRRSDLQQYLDARFVPARPLAPRHTAGGDGHEGGAQAISK